MTNKRGVLTVVSGFSGSGKGTVMKALLAEHDEYVLSVSATTRSPRPGEVDGREYFFVSRERFEEMIENGELLEHASYVGNYYGTPKKTVMDWLEEGKDVLLEIEVQGAMQIKKQFPEAVLMFLTPPTASELVRRLRGRGTETEEVIAGRMARAREEAGWMKHYDYIMINDKLEDCVRDTHELIRAQHWRPALKQEVLEALPIQLAEL